jgi:mannose-6-phosphate isomerase-like protein (cupin superfamily)
MSGGSAFQSAEIEALVARAKAAADGYVNDAVRSDLLSVGIYVLAAGAVDDQTPHDEDEVYYAVRGRGRFQVEGEDEAVGPGSLLFVRAGADHRFHDIEEEMVLVVFWAPPHDEP